MKDGDRCSSYTSPVLLGNRSSRLLRGVDFYLKGVLLIAKADTNGTESLCSGLRMNFQATPKAN
jgi:hypothetical protein